MTEQEKVKLKIEIYTSPTCPYCPAALRMLEKAVRIYNEAIDVVEVSVASTDGQKLAAIYSVQATPTIVINSEVKFRGPPPSESHLFNEIETHLDQDTVKQATKKRQERKHERKAHRREIDMMYG